MVSKAFKVANNLDNEETMLVNGQTFVRQTVVDTTEVFIANPNSGTISKPAKFDSRPMFLMTCVMGLKRYYEDAIATQHDPHAFRYGEDEHRYTTTGNDVAIYALDRSKPVVRPDRKDFNARRQAVMAENEARGIETYIPQAQKAQGGAVVSILKRHEPEMTNG